MNWDYVPLSGTLDLNCDLKRLLETRVPIPSEDGGT